jgi:hypothetical protein
MPTLLHDGMVAPPMVDQALSKGYYFSIMPCYNDQAQKHRNNFSVHKFPAVVAAIESAGTTLRICLSIRQTATDRYGFRQLETFLRNGFESSFGLS